MSRRKKRAENHKFIRNNAENLQVLLGGLLMGEMAQPRVSDKHDVWWRMRKSGLIVPAVSSDVDFKITLKGFRFLKGEIT